MKQLATINPHRPILTREMGLLSGAIRFHFSVIAAKERKRRKGRREEKQRSENKGDKLSDRQNFESETRKCAGA